MFKRLTPWLERLEERALWAVISGDGGQGGTTQSIALNPDLNLVRFQWQNYSIPDEFQILYQGKRIAGDVGLQSGGHQGQKVIMAQSSVIAASSSADALTVKVTAPLAGTAWTFTVEVLPFELNVDGKLGDVIKIDVAQLLRNAGVSLADADLNPIGFGLKATTNPRGKVAPTDTYQDDLQKGVFYFVPTVTGTPLHYGDQHSDTGLGDSEIIVTNGMHEFPVKLHISDGYSTAGENAVVMRSSKLDVYRQEQRLAYLGFPGATGNPLQVDGIPDNDTMWAMKLFSIALDPATSSTPRGSVQAPKQGTKFFNETTINSATPITWNYLANISNIKLTADRQYGLNTSGRLMSTALTQLTRGPIDATRGVVAKNGTGSPSVAHEGGRGVDFDDIPGDYFFNETVVPGPGGGRFVSAEADAGGGFIVRNPDGSYRGGGNPDNPADRQNALRVATLIASQNPNLVQSIRMDYKQTRAEVQAVFDAFRAGGAQYFLHNDPRFIDGVNIRFYNVTNHFNHIHVYIPSPIAGGAQFAVQALSADEVGDTFAGLSFTTLNAGRLSSAIDLGRIDGTQTVSGTLDASQPEQLYRLEIGDVSGDSVGYAFVTPRDLSILLDGLSDDIDVEVIIDPNGDGEGQVLFNSLTPGTAAEQISETGLPPGVYYVRVFKQGGDSTFNLALSVPPLPVPTDNAGNTPATAADLGFLAGSVSRNDFVGEVDPDDFYRFQLSAMSDLDLALAGLDQGDVAVAIGRDENLDGILDPGEVLGYSDAEGNAAESLHLDRLPAGSYLVWVARVSGNSTYQIQVTSALSTIPADRAGDTIATAFDLGALAAPVRVTDFVGNVDPIDYYRFSITSLTGLSIELSGLSADADVEIGRDTNHNGILDPGEVLASARNPGSDADSITLAGLAAGDYVVRVYQYEGDTPYRLSLTTAPASGTDLAVMRTDSTPPVDLGTAFTYALRVTNAGPDMATNVMLTETLLNGLELVNVQPSDVTTFVQYTGNGFTGTIASLPAGASVSFDVTVRSFVTGELLSMTNVSSADTIDFDLSNNNLENGHTVNPITSPAADLELTQTVSNRNPSVGEQITLTLTLTNQGPGTATVIKVRDLLPAGLLYLSSSADLGSYDSTSGNWTVGNLPPNASVQCRLSVKVLSGPAIVNTAEVVGVDEADPDSKPNNHVPSEDDQASATITVQGSIVVNGRVVVSDGTGTPQGMAGQRSMVRTLIIPLSGPVPGLTNGQKFNGTSARLEVGPLVLALKRLQGGPVFTVHATYQVVNHAVRLVLTFSGGAGASRVIGGSLADGDYRLQFVQGFGNGQSDFAFHRLFGDSNGNRVVDVADWTRFVGSHLVARGWLARGYVSYFDYDSDYRLGAADLAAFTYRLVFKPRL